MKLWRIKTEFDYINITAYSVTQDMLAPNVIWADGVRIEFGGIVVYVEEL